MPGERTKEEKRYEISPLEKRTPRRGCRSGAGKPIVMGKPCVVEDDFDKLWPLLEQAAGILQPALLVQLQRAH